MGQAFEDELIREVDEIVKHETFIRASMQVRLLRYLCERTIDSGAGPITQYDIAVEGLGRGSAFDETFDSYVRVQISRLRKNLLTYYSICAPSGAGCVYIKKGHYNLSLGSLHIAYPELDSARRISSEHRNPQDAIELEQATTGEKYAPPPQRNRLGIALSIIIGVLTFVMVGLAFVLGQDEETAPAQAVGEGLQRPTVSVSIDATGPAQAGPAYKAILEAIAAETSQRISRSAILQEGNAKQSPDYLLSITLDADGAGNFSTEILLKGNAGRQIGRYDQAIPSTITGAREVVGWKLASMFSPSGLISRDLAGQIPERPRNDFECFVLTEIGRTVGTSRNKILDFCTSSYPDSAYYPFLKARELFYKIQDEIIVSGSFEPNPAIQSELGELLRTYPDNPYLNTLAAKILFSQGICNEGERHAQLAFEMGRDYPALELAILVEKSSCVTDPQKWAELADRIDQIVKSQRDPDAFMEAYALIGFIIVGRPESIHQIPERPFAYGDDMPVVGLIDAMRAFASGESKILPQSLAALVWNKESYRRIATNGRWLENP